MKKTKRILETNIRKYSGGSVTFLLLFIVIILAIFLSGGVFRNIPEATPGKSGFEIDPSSLQMGGKQDSLQLKTFKFKECGSNMTVDLMLDHSGSMGNPTPTNQTKIARLKEAVLSLTEKMSDTSILGIQSFNSSSIKEEVPISFYRDVKGIVAEKVNALNAGGKTPTHDALAFSRDTLSTALPRFPDRKFNFIFVSDGQPVPDEQDPRLFNPNPADQIKSLGINVYALAIYDAGQTGDPKLAELMKSIASRPENYFAADTADDTKRLLETISERICAQ